MKLANRISRISVSKTMAVMEAALNLREQGLDVVDFGPGEPDFPTPENIKQAGMRAIEGDFTKYTATGGIKELKKAIVEKHARDFGSKYDLPECIVNFGGKHVEKSVFAAEVHDAFRQVVLRTEVAGMLLYDRFLELLNAAGGRVLREVALDSSHSRLLDVFRRRKIRLAGAEVHHVETLLAEVER